MSHSAFIPSFCQELALQADRMREGNGTPLSPDEQKQLLGCSVARLVQPEQTIGFGSGSTAIAAVRAIVATLELARFSITAVPTSDATEGAARRSAYIQISPLASLPSDGATPIDWGFDGSDRVYFVDGRVVIIKGGGGAQKREKDMWMRCRQVYCLVDESKVGHDMLGDFPIPIEVQDVQMDDVRKNLHRMFSLSDDALVCRQLRSGETFLTDNGNPILDMRIAAAPRTVLEENWEEKIEAIPGVVRGGCGLFIAQQPAEIWTFEHGTVKKIPAG